MLTPQPPLDMAVDKTAEFGITAALAGIVAVALAVSFIDWYRTGRPLMLSLMLSGGAIMVFEPMVDTVGGCWFPSNSWTAFSAWGRPLPVWLCLAYFFYFGIATSTIWTAMRKGLTQRQVWVVFCAAMLGDLAFETVLLTMNPYVYYGYQPLLLGRFPLWWMAVNAAIPLVLAALIYRFDSYFRGRKTLAVIPLALTTSAAVNAALGWPSWLVINTDVGWLLTQVGGLATFVVACYVVKLVATVVASPVTGREALPRATRQVPT
ncbi:hypothetical protein [Mycobacterium palustre]|nr:hypothetical protein [Mycobacterium palustre]MCV7099020.1 hypothetical protein [Mycobacterium palustre]